MEKLKTIGTYTFNVFHTAWIFTVYMIFRVLKTPLWDLEIDPFGSWKHFEDTVDRETAIVAVSILCLTGYYFLSWWLFISVAGFGLLNLIIFLVAMLIRSRKKGSDVISELQLVKNNAKFWKK
jgi:hypothetical protein